MLMFLLGFLVCAIVWFIKSHVRLVTRPTLKQMVRERFGR